MAIMGKCLERGINLYTTKEGYSFDNTINSKVLCFAFGLVAEIERNLISMRTREALALVVDTSIGGHRMARELDALEKDHKALLDQRRPREDGKPRSSQITYVADRPGHDRRYAIDPTKIEAEIGWTPAESFETGIDKTVKWYLENTAWIDSVRTGAYREWVSKNYSTRD